ncbi:hypothetical protein DPMN_158060 [Dreissena polymorpha]|uniref:Uncharacterized protein n=1 Tax=Dreissena polymorpha TaxID=45954 RepID=A0A9D4EIG3_DREPO|nr:hypothetical protein DPMN_158060 [Dreissena polymorpha]
MSLMLSRQSGQINRFKLYRQIEVTVVKDKFIELANNHISRETSIHNTPSHRTGVLILRLYGDPGRSEDAIDAGGMHKGRSEDAENCSGREPTATSLNMFKVVAEIRCFTAFC